MKQILQDLGSGETTLARIPVHDVSAGALLIQSFRSLVSAGTERMLVDFDKANLFRLRGRLRGFVDASYT